MLPIQMFLFEIINKHTDKQVIKANFLMHYKMDTVMFNNVIASFLGSKIIKILPTASEHLQFKINVDYEGSDNVDLIYYYNKYANTEVIIDKKIQNELVHKKETIISSVVNHFLKLEDSKTKIDLKILFEKSKDNIKLFELDDKLFNTTINMMIQKDLISVDNGFINKLVY